MKRIDLKVAWNSYNWANIYQNVSTFGKCFELWIKKEQLTTDFLKTYINEVNKDFSYTHYNIGIRIDFIVSELSFVLDDFFERVKKKLVNKLYGKTFPWYLESLEKVFPFIKENILGIYKQTIYLKNYWGYHTPNNIHWRSNNIDIAKTLRRNFSWWIDAVQNENQEQRIFGNADVEFYDTIAPIFPWELWFDKKNKGAIPIKYIDDEADKKLDELVDSIYEYFINNDMVEFINLIEAEADKENKWIMWDFLSKEWDAKDIFMKYFLLQKDKLIWFVLDSYFKKSSIYWLDYYLYENQYFLDLSDLVFVWEYIEKTKGEYMLKNRFNLEMLKQMLVDGLKDGYFDHFVMKLTYYFDNENWENYQVTERGEDLFEFFDGKETNLVELDKQEQRFMKLLGSAWKRKIRWGITLGLYSQKLSKMKEFKMLMANHFKIAWYKIFFRKWGGENIFEHNNYLFQQNPIKTVTNLTPAYNIKRFFDIMPEISKNDEDGIYLWINWFNKQPIIKQPFLDTISLAKHMAVIWKSGSWKTFFFQQLSVTNIRDKFFVIDPTWTFSKLWLITDSITVVDVFKMDYNPIALDKKTYDAFNINWRKAMVDKIAIIMWLLKPEELWANVSKDFLNILQLYFAWLYENYETVTIDLIFESISELVKTKTYPDGIELGVNTDRNVDKLSLNYFNALLRKIAVLKSEWDLYNLLNKKSDLLNLFLNNTKLVINIVDLNITKKDWLDERARMVLMFLMQNMITYTWFNAAFVSKNKSKIEFAPRSYIVFDEIHLMLHDDVLKKLYALLIRTLRNQGAQITGLTQKTWDFAFSDWEGDSKLDVLENQWIKIFFHHSDILAYINILNSSFGLKNQSSSDKLEQEDDPPTLKKLKFYYMEYMRIWEENKTPDDVPEEHQFRLMLVQWFEDYYICIPQVSEFFKKKLSLLKSGN